jgi:hypothetical protein
MLSEAGGAPAAEASEAASTETLSGADGMKRLTRSRFGEFGRNLE